MVCSLADGLAALQAQGVTAARIILVGGGAQSAAVQQIAASVFDLPVVVPEPGEYVADGAARQAAAVLTGRWPEWDSSGTEVPGTGTGSPDVLEQYRRYASTYVNG
ncbi:xylulokinase [compost metagenome]